MNNLYCFYNHKTGIKHILQHLSVFYSVMCSTVFTNCKVITLHLGLCFQHGLECLCLIEINRISTFGTSLYLQVYILYYFWPGAWKFINIIWYFFIRITLCVYVNVSLVNSPEYSYYLPLNSMLLFCKYWLE